MTLPILAIVAGSLVFFLSLLGCFGTFVEYRKVLFTYFGLLLLLVLFEFLIGILALTNRGETVEQAIDARWQYLYDHKPRYIRDIEEQYGCCGLHNTTDRAWPKRYSINVTAEACVKDPNFGYHQPCLYSVKDEWEDRQTALGIGVIVIASLQFLGLIPTYYLAQRLPANPRDRDLTLQDEHRRLLASHSQRPDLPGSLAHGGYGTGASTVGADGIQHPVGGLAGSYHHPTKRPGSRAG
ncbi:Leukocyte surface antigen cd53 [Borealophlyctis nickersoniae]|nr:Leukocyte surface antigen cd53 [Borealophlyctis nickersoniae]